jgi:hypothetical protein
MAVIEAHIDNLAGGDVDMLEELIGQSPLPMTQLHIARAEMKRLFHPRASAMKMKDLIEYVYWITKALSTTHAESPQCRRSASRETLGTRTMNKVY